MQEFININDAARILNFKDVRTIKNWCLRKGIEIFSEEGSRKKYILFLQFEYARMKRVIEFLKIKYKDKWLEALKAYEQFDLIHIVELEEERMLSSKVNCYHDSKPCSYKPLGYEMKVMSRLTQK